MQHHELEANLKQLHEELERAPAIDPEARELLVTVLQDIQRTLESTPSEMASPDEETDSMLDRLRGVTESFEESHPFVATLIGRIADGLSNLGI